VTCMRMPNVPASWFNRIHELTLGVRSVPNMRQEPYRWRAASDQHGR
jgi:hypothetical protein